MDIGWCGNICRGIKISKQRLGESYMIFTKLTIKEDEEMKNSGQQRGRTDEQRRERIDEQHRSD